MTEHHRFMDIGLKIQLKCKKVGECLIWQGYLVKGKYPGVWYKNKNRRVNRIICHLYHGADLDDNSWTANHKRECTSTRCCNPDHIYVGTPQQNVQDQIATGNFHYGIENLTWNKNYKG